jgi:photosystem II stability/assembly factor-like uncharacterized protein
MHLIGSGLKFLVNNGFFAGSKCRLRNVVASCFVLLVVLTVPGFAGEWAMLGPDGGDARSLAYDPANPDHIFVGTSAGSIFKSMDGGRHWEFLVHLGKSDDYVIDHIIIDPRDSKLIYVGAWGLNAHDSGELFRSYDGGESWAAIPAMHRKSIRSIVLAPSESNVVIVGALDGVFRSRNRGQTWQRISHQRTEITNVESIAIDPQNSDIVYVGTWHLGWKTLNGGLNWQRVQAGIIDDSDVFSIIVGESNSSTIFLSACSGIYKSLDAGRIFERVQSVPFSARRTRVLKQDPNDPAVVYAGTTEGLWLTKDSGTTWKRVTNPEVVVNDVLIDPGNSKHVLLATDRSGILASDNEQLEFTASNSGFTHRYISSVLLDRVNPDVIYVSVRNDRERGGVFVSNDAGSHWTQISAGLDERDVLILKQANDGSVLAGTNRGLLVLDRKGLQWVTLDHLEQINPEKPESATSSLKVNDIEITLNKWLAATSAGLYVSFDNGETWIREPQFGRTYLVSARAQGRLTAVTGRRKVFVSSDQGHTWRACRGLPSFVNGIQSLTIGPGEQIIVVSRKGVFRSKDLGARWSRIYRGLPSKNLNCITYDEFNHRLLATAASNTDVYDSEDGYSWHRASRTGHTLRAITASRGRVLVATAFDGLGAQMPNTTEHR